ncbi:MAG TPA: hypothetical protein VKD25_11200, partial [Burkholderiales bacterium]|nr:hypothetical protein [Burkholderiales bacterium]
ASVPGRFAGRWTFQYIALDDCTRFRVLLLYRRLRHGSNLALLAELWRAFPFPVKQRSRSPSTSAEVTSGGV